MKCKHCNTQITSKPDLSNYKCPVCGQEFYDPKIFIKKKEPHEILHGIVLRYGKDKLSDPLLKGILSDLITDKETKYLRIFRQAVDDKLGGKLLEIENEDSAVKAINIDSLKHNFKEKNGFNNTAFYVFDCFLFALGWIESISRDSYFLDGPEGLEIISQQLDLAMIDGSLKKDEIISVFINAEKYGISENDTAELIRKKIKSQKFKPCSGINKTLKSQKQILCSCDWFSESISGSYAEITTEEGNDYKGEVLNGMPHGKGVLSYSNGTKYVGKFVNGKAYGKGTITYASLERYKGDWENDLPHGRGVFTWPSGSKYKGEFRDGKFHGKGTLTDKDGWKYSGIYVNGKLINEHLEKNKKRINDYKKIEFEDELVVSLIYSAPIGFVMGIIFCIISQKDFFSYLYLPLIWAAVSGIVIPGSLYLFSALTQSNLFYSTVAIIIQWLIYLIICAVIYYSGSFDRNPLKPETIQEPSEIEISSVSQFHSDETSLEPFEIENPPDSEFQADNFDSKTGFTIKGTEIQSSFWKRSVNKAHLMSVYKFLNNGKLYKLGSHTTEDSALHLYLYEARFLWQDRLIFRKNFLPKYKIHKVREFSFDSTLTYFIVTFKLDKPQKYQSEYSFNKISESLDMISESLSPWIKSLGNGMYQDSIPVINGLIEFNYGKDNGLSELNAASIATLKVDWLNVRETPSLNARIIGKLAKHHGEFFEQGKIYDTSFGELHHTILVDSESEKNGFILCYVIDEITGRYERGYVWREHLDIDNKSL